METTKAATNLAVRASLSTIPRASPSTTPMASSSTTPMAPNATELAFLVKKYLEDQNFSETLNLFGKEAAPFLSSTVRICPRSTCLTRVLSEYVRLTLEKEDMTVKLRESLASNSTLQRQLQEGEASNSALEHKLQLLQEVQGRLGAIRGRVEAAPSHERLPLKRKRIVAPKAPELSAPAPVNWPAATFVGETSSGCGLRPSAAWEVDCPGWLDAPLEFIPGLTESPEPSGRAESYGLTDQEIVDQVLEGIRQGKWGSPSLEPVPIDDILSQSFDDIDGMFDCLGDLGHS